MRSLTALVLIAVALLAGCTPSADYADLEAFMAEEDSRPSGRIEPLPTIETIAPFSYKAGNKRSPFAPPVVLKRVDRKSGPSVTPDFKRVKQHLEQFNIGQLGMVGTLAQGDSVFALIRDNEGSVHRVQAGDYMGTDHGKIQAVDEEGVELIEIVPDGTGGWVERARTVRLAGGA